MSTNFLLYGAHGFVGEIAARLALQSGLRLILAGRNAYRLKGIASSYPDGCFNSIWQLILGVILANPSMVSSTK